MRSKLGKVAARARFLFPRVLRIDGREKYSGESISITWIGPERQLEYLLNRIFGQGEVVRRPLGRSSILSLSRLQRELDSDLAIVALPGNVLSWISRKEDIEIPWWIDSDVRLGSENSVVNTSSAKADRRRIRKHKLSYEVTSTAAEYRSFYKRIYLPTITASHGAAALPSSFENRMSELRTGKFEILLVKMSGRTIGGLLMDYRNEVPAFRDGGVIDGDKSLLNTGVIAATNIFGFEYLKSQGYDRVCIGLSRCFLDDGVLNYKQKWLPELTEPSQQTFLFRIYNLNSAVRTLLRSSSFVSKRNGKLCLTFLEANDEDESRSRLLYERLTKIYGIEEAKFIDVSGNRPRAKSVS